MVPEEYFQQWRPSQRIWSSGRKQVIYFARTILILSVNDLHSIYAEKDELEIHSVIGQHYYF